MLCVKGPGSVTASGGWVRGGCDLSMTYFHVGRREGVVSPFPRAGNTNSYVLLLGESPLDWLPPSPLVVYQVCIFLFVPL